jgi:hypothetical protein
MTGCPDQAATASRAKVSRLVRVITWYPLMVAAMLGGFLMIPVLVFETARREGILQAIGMRIVSTGYQFFFSLLILSPSFLLLAIFGVQLPNLGHYP